jgi:cobalamin synthase
VIGEAVAKLGMVVSAFMGPPARGGLGELFINKLREGPRGAKLVASASMCLAISLLLGPLGFIACATGVLASVAIVGVARRRFGGADGGRDRGRERAL